MSPEKLVTLDVLKEFGRGLTQSMIDDYIESLTAHIAYVQEACRDVWGLPEKQWRAHDLSKWTMDEFPHYVRRFHGPNDDPDGFAYAWLHHIHQNQHHPQHWVFSDGYTPKGSSSDNGAMPMPREYVVEMVADWMGASRVYTGSWDMSDWLIKNLPKIRLHPKTSILLETLLTSGVPDYSHVYAELRAEPSPVQIL